MKAVLFLAFLSACTTASAQYNSNDPYGYNNGSGYGLMLSAGFDVPMHHLSGIFNPAPAFDAGVTKSVGNFMFGLNAGYRSYKPKTGYDYYGPASTSGTDLYSNYSVFSVYASAVYNINVSRGAAFYAGLNAGSSYASYTYYYYDASITDEEHYVTGYGYVAPKLGVSFAVDEYLKLGIEARYNLFGSASYNYNTYYGSSSSGVLFTSLAAGVTLNYRFP